MVHVACKHVSQSLDLFGTFLEVLVLDRQWIYFSLKLALLRKCYCSQQSFTFFPALSEHFFTSSYVFIIGLYFHKYFG